MRILALFIVLVFCQTVLAQNASFGISLEGSGSLISSKKQSIQTLNTNFGIPVDAELIHPHSVWNTKQIGFDFYIDKPKGLSLSVGVRMFQYGYEIDTVSISLYSGSFSPPTGTWETFHGRQKKKGGYILPTIGIGYEFELFEHFWLKNSLSMGITSFSDYAKSNTYAYKEHQDAFTYWFDSQGELNNGSYSFYFEKEILDLKLQSAFAWRHKGLSIYAGPSFYFFRYKGWINYTGLHIDVGLSYRFARKEK